jgi:hypothetical protein
MIGVLANAESASGDEITDGLNSLNDVIENLSLENLSVWGGGGGTFPLVIGQASYTIGPLGNFATNRPVRIDDAYCTVNGVDFILNEWDVGQYNAVAEKDTGGIPEFFAYDNSFPLAVLYLYPVPSQAMTISLSVPTLITSVASPTTTISLPPGYAKMLRALLAVEMSPEYGRPVTDTLRDLATQAKADVRRSNQKPAYAGFDIAIGGLEANPVLRG